MVARLAQEKPVAAKVTETARAQPKPPIATLSPQINLTLLRTGHSPSLSRTHMTPMVQAGMLATATRPLALANQGWGTNLKRVSPGVLCVGVQRKASEQLANCRPHSKRGPCMCLCLCVFGCLCVCVDAFGQLSGGPTEYFPHSAASDPVD